MLIHMNSLYCQNFLIAIQLIAELHDAVYGILILAP